MRGPPTFPDIAETGRVLATSNDWRAILIVAMFLVVTLVVFIIWREFALSGLKKAIDKVADALWALKLTIAEERAAAAKEQVAASHERELADAERGRASNREAEHERERGRQLTERKRVEERDKNG